jgi:hypothetical protein
MAVSPPPHLPAHSNAHPTAAWHLGDRVEATGAAIEAVQSPAAHNRCMDGVGRREVWRQRFRRTDNGCNSLYLPLHHIQSSHHRRRASRQRDRGGGVRKQGSLAARYCSRDGQRSAANTSAITPSLLQPAEQPTTSSVACPIFAEPQGGGETASRVVVETTGPSETVQLLNTAVEMAVALPCHCCCCCSEQNNPPPLL